MNYGSNPLVIICLTTPSLREGAKAQGVHIQSVDLAIPTPLGRGRSGRPRLLECLGYREATEPWPSQDTTSSSTEVAPLQKRR